MSWNGGMSYGNQGAAAPGYGYQQYGAQQPQSVGYGGATPQINGVPMYVQPNQGYNGYGGASSGQGGNYTSGGPPTPSYAPQGSYSPVMSHAPNHQAPSHSGYGSPTATSTVSGGAFVSSPSYPNYAATSAPPTSSYAPTYNNMNANHYNGTSGGYNANQAPNSPQQMHGHATSYQGTPPPQDYGYGQNVAVTPNNSVQARANALNYGGNSGTNTTSNYTPPMPTQVGSQGYPSQPTQNNYSSTPPQGFGVPLNSNSANKSTGNFSSSFGAPGAQSGYSTASSQYAPPQGNNSQYSSSQISTPSYSGTTAQTQSPTVPPRATSAASPPPLPKRGAPASASTPNSGTNTPSASTPPVVPKRMGAGAPQPPLKDAQVAKTTASHAAAKRSFPLPPSGQSSASTPSTSSNNSPAGPSPSSSSNAIPILRSSAEAPITPSSPSGVRTFTFQGYGGAVSGNGSSNASTAPPPAASTSPSISKLPPLKPTATNNNNGGMSKAKTGEPIRSESGGSTSPRGFKSPSPPLPASGASGNVSQLIRASSRGALPRYGINNNSSSANSSPTSSFNAGSKHDGANAKADASFHVAAKESTAPSGTVLSGISAFSGSPSPGSSSGPSGSYGSSGNGSNGSATTFSTAASQTTHFSQHKHAHSSPSAMGPSSNSSNSNNQSSNSASTSSLAPSSSYSSSTALSSANSSSLARAASPARVNLGARSASSGEGAGEKTGSSRSVSPAPESVVASSGKSSKYLMFSSVNANLSDLPSQLWKSKYAILHTITVIGSPKLGTMSPKLSGLKSLTALTFRGCGMTMISTSIDHLGNHLLKLDVGENKLETIPDWIGTVFNGLQQLSVDRNALKTLPPSVGRLGQLRALDVSHNLFSTLDPNLSGLTQLQLLSVAHNNLLQLPPCIDKMKSLTAVDVSDNKLRGPLPTALLSSMRQLTSFNVSQNSLGDVTTEICLLAPKLTNLNWSENKAKSLHDALWTLTKLQKLSLSGNLLTEVSEKVSRLTNLTELNLENNQFDILPHQLFALPLLTPQSLQISPNPFRAIPSEIRSSSSPTAIYRFLAQLSEKAPWRRMKLMLVGNGNIGKTSLKRALSSTAFSNATSSSSSKAISKIKGKAKDAFKRIGESLSGSSSNEKLSATGNSAANDSSTFDPTDTIATDGIDIDDWVVDLDDYQECIPEDKSSSSSTTSNPAHGDASSDEDQMSQVAVLSCYDFAGQDVYYPTHSLFVTSRSIYLVMFSLKDLEGSRVEYWLQMVHAKAGYTSPVVIVATHEDDKSVDKNTIPDILAQTKKKYSRFPFVKGVVSISSKTGSGIPQLRKLILTLALSHPTMKEQVPRSYLLLEEEIKKRRKLCGSSSSSDSLVQASHERQTVSLEEWHAMAERCFFKSKEDSMAALGFLSDVGVVFYFKSDSQPGNSLASSLATNQQKQLSSSSPVQGLENVVILDPQWIADLLSTVISLKHNYIKEGVLDESVLPHLWKLYPRDLHADLLSLLKRFEIVLPMATAGKFMVPSMLPKDEVILGASSSTSTPPGSIDFRGDHPHPSHSSNPSNQSNQSSSVPTSSGTTPNPLLAGLGGGIGATTRQRTGTASSGSSSHVPSISAPISNSGSSGNLAPRSEDGPSHHSTSGGDNFLPLFNRLWMSRDKWYGPMGTVVSMKFCPMGFFGRFVARALHLPSLKVISYSMSTFVAEHSQTGERVSVLYNEWTYEVLLFSASPRPLASSSRTLLFAVTDCMEILHESLYSSNRRSVFVVCPHCVSEGFSSPTLFLLEDALIAFTERVASLPCTQCAMIGSDHQSSASSEPGSVASTSPVSTSPQLAPASSSAAPPASLKRKFSVFHNAMPGKKASTANFDTPPPVTSSASSPHLANNPSSTNSSGSPSGTSSLLGLVQSEGIIDQASGQYLFSSSSPIFVDFAFKKDKCKSKSVFLGGDDEDSSEMESSGSNSAVRVSTDSDSHVTSSATGMSTSTSSSNDSEPGTNSIVFMQRAGRSGSFTGQPASSNPNGSPGSTSKSSSGGIKVSVRGRIEVRLDKIAPDVSFHSLDHLLVPYEAIKMENLIATGGFAEIFKSQYKGETVAVKRFLSSSEGIGGGMNAANAVSEEFSESFRELQHEAFLMAKLSHPNVVALKALCVRPICMVMEFVPHGTLGGLLWGKEARLLSWPTRLKYAHDIASGLAYLHSLNIMHLDFRSLNLLVHHPDPSADVCIKVADFGLSTNSSGSHKGIKAFNPFWSSPEILNRHTYSLSTDIYSLGIVIWELLQQGRPFEEHRANYPGPEIILTGAIANNNLRPSFPSGTPEPIKQLIVQCWHSDPAQRPLASDVVRSIESITFQYQKKPSAWADPLFNPPRPEEL